MLCCEVIRIRSMEKPDAQVREEVRRRILQETENEQDLVDFRFMENVDLKTDAAVVLFWKADRKHPLGSALVENLINILSPFGQVSQSAWREIP